MQTHSPSLSTALCHTKSPPSAYPSFSFFGRPPTSLRALYLSFIAERFRSRNLLQLFFSRNPSLFILTKSHPSIPLILLLPFLNLSHHLIRSRITHECGMVVPVPAFLPNCLGVFVCQCESGGKPPHWSLNHGWCRVRWSFVGIRARPLEGVKTN